VAKKGASRMSAVSDCLIRWFMGLRGKVKGERLKGLIRWAMGGVKKPLGCEWLFGAG
jgi:hypothetical protein